jgi:high affinity sulfate transporter 1
MTAATSKRTRARGGLPLLEGVLPIDSARLPLDVVAGVTLACLAIPEVMGYTKIAETPVITGLYTILLPVLIFAIFGSSRHLVVGADSATAAILAAGLVGMAQPNSAEWVALASWLALIAAAFLLIARILRLGFLANFLSRSVLIGFLTGVGIQVAAGQFPALFGLPKTGDNPVQWIANTIADFGSASLPTFAVAVGVLVVIVGAGMINKKIPGALFAVLGSILLSYALDWATQGISTLGAVPGGLPQFGLPPMLTQDQLVALLPTAFSIFIVILAQSAATSRAYALRYSDSFSENVDLVGLGLASVGAGISGTFVVNGSPTKTEMVDSAGGRSQVAQLTTFVIVAVVLLFLTGPLSYMPNAVLAAVVFLIGIRLVDYKGMADVYRLRKGEFAVASITAIAVIFIGVEQGILLAMALSVIEHIYHSYKPYDVLLAPSGDGTIRGSSLETGAQAAPGLLVYRFGASVYYANTNLFMEEVLRLVEDAQPPVRWICFDGAVIGDVDYSAADALHQLHGELERMGVTVVLCDLSDKVARLLDEYELTDLIGKSRIYDTVADALAAYRAAPPSGGPAAVASAPPPSGGPAGAPGGAPTPAPD